MQEVFELLVDFCARLGNLILRPLGVPRLLGPFYGVFAWVFGLFILLAILAGVILLVLW